MFGAARNLLLPLVITIEVVVAAHQHPHGESHSPKLEPAPGSPISQQTLQSHWDTYKNFRADDESHEKGKKRALADLQKTEKAQAKGRSGHSSSHNSPKSEHHSLPTEHQHSANKEQSHTVQKVQGHRRTPSPDVPQDVRPERTETDRNRVRSAHSTEQLAHRGVPDVPYSP